MWHGGGGADQLSFGGPHAAKVLVWPHVNSHCRAVVARAPRWSCRELSQPSHQLHPAHTYMPGSSSAARSQPFLEPSHVAASQVQQPSYLPGPAGRLQALRAAGEVVSSRAGGRWR